MNENEVEEIVNAGNPEQQPAVSEPQPQPEQEPAPNTGNAFSWQEPALQFDTQDALAASNAVGDAELRAMVLLMWVNDLAEKASKRLEELARQDGLEFSDEELTQMGSEALFKYNGDVDAAYSVYALPRLRSKFNQPKQEEETPVEAGADTMQRIILAGYSKR